MIVPEEKRGVCLILSRDGASCEQEFVRRALSGVLRRCRASEAVLEARADSREQQAGRVPRNEAEGGRVDQRAPRLCGQLTRELLRPAEVEQKQRAHSIELVRRLLLLLRWRSGLQGLKGGGLYSSAEKRHETVAIGLWKRPSNQNQVLSIT